MALVSTFRHPHAYSWNQLNKFYQMSINCGQAVLESDFSCICSSTYTGVNVGGASEQIRTPTEILFLLGSQFLH